MFKNIFTEQLHLSKVSLYVLSKKAINTLFSTPAWQTQTNIYTNNFDLR